MCVCVGGGGCLCVRKFPVFLVFCHVERERERDNVKLIFVFDLKKEKLSEFERLGTVPSYDLFLFFFFFSVLLRCPATLL